MNRKEAKRLLPYMQAWVEDKEVEFKQEPYEWELLPKAFDWDFAVVNECQFRFKAEKKYRPFQGIKECWAELFNHFPFGWAYDKANNEYFYISNVADTHVGVSYEKAFEDCVFADGKPFGVVETNEQP